MKSTHTHFKLKLFGVIIFCSIPFCSFAQNDTDTVTARVIGSQDNYLFFNDCLFSLEEGIRVDSDLAVKEKNNTLVYYPEYWNNWANQNWIERMYICNSITIGVKKDNKESLYRLHFDSYRNYMYNLSPSDPDELYSCGEVSECNQKSFSLIKSLLYDKDFLTIWLGADNSSICIETFGDQTAPIFANGHSDKEEWKKYSRIKRMKFYIDDEFMGIVELEDSRTLQTIDPELFPNYDGGRRYLFEVIETYPGVEFSDIAISEIILTL